MVAAETRQSAGDAMAELRGSRAGVARLGRANGILTAASASFRGQARPGTALVVACVDGFRDRSRGGPACGAPARGVLEVHAGFFMAVYGCRKTRARSSAQGRDPAGTGRGRVMDVVREPGVGGVCRGGTPVTTRPARGAGGGPGLAGLVVRGGAPGPAARGRHRLRAHGQRTLRLHGEPADVLARGLAGRSCATAMDTGGRRGRRNRRYHGAASHGGADGLVRRSGHGARCIGLVYATGVGESGMPPPAGTAGDPYRHGRERRRRVQDPRLAARALPGSEGPGIGDVPVGLVAGTRSVRTGPRTAGHRNGPKPGIARTKRCKPPHYKSGTKIRPYHYD